MNILILNSGRKWIGEVAHTYQLARGLAQRGHRVIVGARTGTPLSVRLQEETAGSADNCLQSAEFNFTSSFRPLSEWADLGLLRRIITAEQIELVQVNRGKEHWLAAMALRTMPQRMPLVRTRHVVIPARRHSFNRWLFNRATAALIGVSNKALDSVRPVLRKESLRSKGGPQLVRRILSAVDIDNFSPAKRSSSWREQLGLGSKHLLIGLIGRFQGIKGQEIFLTAAGRVAERYPEARFFLAGTGKPRRIEKYRRIAKELGFADRLLIEGFIEELPQAVASLDIGVIASRGSEGSSRVCLEYLASGLSVVATRVGGIPELLEGGEQRGLLVDPDAPEQLAEQVERLAEDAELRQRLGQAGRRHVENHHRLERWLGDFEAVYEELIAGGHERKPS